MKWNHKGMFGAVVISQPDLEIVTVVTKDLHGKVVMRRFAIATLKDNGRGDIFRVVAFVGKDFKTGDPRDLGGGMTKLAAMAIREETVAAYVRESDAFKMRHFTFEAQQSGITLSGAAMVQAGHTVTVPRNLLG